VRVAGGLVSHQSPAFQEEFPSLAPEEKGKETKKDEDSKDTQYGPGPSLRPQSQYTTSSLSMSMDRDRCD
jgi:hypothetical protein